VNRPRLIAFVAVAACLAGCVQSGAGLAPRSPGSTPQGTFPSPSAVATASPAAASESACSPPDAGLITIGRQNAGTTVAVPTGANVLVKLGTDLMWTVSVGDPAILARVPGVTLVRGAQGLYLAGQAGRTTITAVGDPACRSNQPPCMAPSLEWSATVVVD
jgi:hypothetical protein